MWPRGRVSLEPVTSSTVCLVAAGLGLMPLSTDFALYLETLSFHQVAAERRMCKAGGEALPGTAGPGHLHLQLAGSAVIAFGLWFRFGGTIKDLSSEDKSPEYFYVGLYVLVGAGALMMAVGFCGCCGAMRESQCILGSFQCCGKESSEQVQPTCPKELLGHKNCINEIETAISIKLQLIGIVGIGVAGLTIFGMIFSMVLCCAIRNSRDMI
ncbi:tetraspanin-2 isoform X3 [Choloepus didactylus]|uniref:tetraspanin-2 isoform X3 n=1 Tax=Choloepus didactylus TaxID=27675 RepID=UPI00189DE97D|nr:tetraspanin-2 isoform X3 [Choloepus didactylus]